MVLEFKLPDTGEGVTEGKFLEWLVEEGEKVEEDQIVAEVETDKAVVDVPAPANGTIKNLEASPGDVVDVGEVIMEMENGTETAEDEGSGEEKMRENKEKESVEEETNETEVGEEQKSEIEKQTSGRDAGAEEASTNVLALPKVRKLAERKGVNLEELDKSGRVREEDVINAASGIEQKQATESQEETESVQKEEKDREVAEKDPATPSIPDDVAATPAVRKLAREKKVDLQQIEGSGRGGKIVREDVLDAAEETGEKVEKVSETGTSGSGISDEEEREPLEGVRKIVAEKMEESKFTAPHVTHIEKADITELVELREKRKEEVEPHLTYLPFIAKAASIGLKKHPLLNAELDEENQEIVKKKDYDFNIAVDTERGLMTPVIEEVDEKSIVEIASGIEKVAEEARENDLSPEQLRNGAFTLTNIGAIGGEAFTPIINYPQVAILGIGEIQETAEVIDGGIEPRNTVKLSLSYDHRVIDGAEAARFMNEVVENLENPGEMLLEL